MDPLQPPQYLPPASRHHPARRRVIQTWFLVLLAFGGLLHVLFAGFVFDPDDFPPEYWRDQITLQTGLLVVAALLPVAAVVLATVALIPDDRREEVAISLYTAIVFAALLEFAILYVGLGNIEYSQRHAGPGTAWGLGV